MLSLLNGFLAYSGGVDMSWLRYTMTDTSLFAYARRAYVKMLNKMP